MRLIDADRLKRQVEGRSWRAKDKMVELIDNSPTIEAEPVKHGRWIVVSDGYGKKATRRWNYCPNCGARMEVKDEPLREV